MQAADQAPAETETTLPATRRETFTHLRYVVLFCLVFWLICFSTALLQPVYVYNDYLEYLKIVAGHVVDVHEPFVGRPLAPMITRAIISLTGADAGATLTAVCMTGWALTPILAASLLRLRRAPLGWALVVASLPFPGLSARFFEVPDAWAINIVLTLFMAVETGKGIVAGAAAFALALTRSSSALAVTAQWIATRRNGRGWIWAAAAGALVLGLIVKAPLIHGNHGNQHKMASWLYIAGKIPVNGLANLAGEHLYTNTFAYCPKPVAVLFNGHARILGNIHTVGFCKPSFKPILISALNYLFIFGVVPVAAVRILWRERSGGWIALWRSRRN